MISPRPFAGSFTQQEPIPDVAIDVAVDVMRSGRLHRYNLTEGEAGEAALLERDFAHWQERTYCLACASGGYAMHLALRASGVAPGDVVLTNGFTLAPVPGAIVNAGATPVLVEVTQDLMMDLDDLEKKIIQTGARYLLLSNMRGHLSDMGRMMPLLDEAGVTLIEDCAHTMGARWNGTLSGNFGLAGCFSTQTYKHLNSGEGGLLVSNDPAFMARAIIASGSYMQYGRHGAAPSADYFTDIRLETPNFSGRMDNLRAAILRPQLAALSQNIERWDMRCERLESRLKQVPAIYVPHRAETALRVGSSVQFLVPGISHDHARAFLERTSAMGVELKWFGDREPKGFTSSHHSWKYMQPQYMPQTDEVLSGLFDMRIPLTFSLDDCDHIADILCWAVETMELAA